MAIDLTTTDIDPTHPLYHPLLDDLQGNILKGHGRNFSVHLFIRFRKNTKAVRQWIQRFGERYVTSAMEQYDAARRYRMDPEKYGTELFASFMLTARGYEALGFSEDNLPGDKRFRLGMKHTDVRNWLHDVPDDQWEPGFREEIHGLILLANSLDPSLENSFRTIVETVEYEVAEVAEVVHTERGHVLRKDGESGPATEHFGYVDGVSQPLFYEQGITAAKKSAGRGLWDPGAPLNLVVTRDPNGSYEDSCGSYFVYRKYRQDVAKFYELVDELSDALDGDFEFAGACVIGRFTDGTPLVLSGKPENAGNQNGKQVPNNFTYDWDTKGKKCPFHAHIRKANPRGEKHDEAFTRLLRFLGQFAWLRKLFPRLDKAVEEMDKMERSRRIARRGITYGPANPGSGENAGLLFLCAQADIARQFEFIQGIWSNKNTFPEDDTGLDPVIGQGYQQEGGQQWPRRWKSSQKIQFDFSQCIELRGGEYFFAPSLSFLQNIDREE